MVRVVRYFTGVVDAYIGKLAVGSWSEGRGAGRAPLAAAEGRAVSNGYERVTLETGAANDRARDFYSQAHYKPEGVRLTKLLT